MKLMEYQAQTLFKKFGLPVQPGCVVSDPDETLAAIEREDVKCPLVVKAQVQIGGRGKAGGIQFADTPEQAAEHAKRLIGSTLRGLKVGKVYIVEKAVYSKEWYLSIMLDRLSKQPMIIFSAMGGMEIEETAKTDPDKIKKLIIDPMIGVQDYMARYLLSSSGLPVELTKQLDALLKGLYHCFMEYDCMLTEINPLVVTEEGKLIALDGKVDVDENLPIGMKHLANILKFGIIDEAIDPFQGPIWDQKGDLRCEDGSTLTPEQLIRMDWLCDAVDGSIPEFDDLLPRSQNLVRLLGVHRESIPPVTEELEL